MSMRVGDESGRARAEAIDPALARDRAGRHAGGRRCSGAPRVRRFRRHALAMVGLGFLVFMVLACFVGAQFAPSPTEQHLLRADVGPVVRRTGSAPTS